MKTRRRNFSPSWREEQLATALLRHARIVTDPKKLARIRAQAAKLKRLAEAEGKGTL